MADSRTWTGLNAWGIPFVEDEHDALEKNPPRGVFGEHPASTPKYLARVPQHKDFRATMARMFVEISKSTAAQLDKYVAAAFPNDATTQSLARVLMGNAGVASSKGGCGFVDFLLQSVNMPLQEKVDVVECLSDSYVAYYFGSAAPRWTFSGTVYNTKQDDQANALMRMYLYILRGTQLARRNKLLRVRFDDRIATGTLNNQTLTLSGDMEMALSFSFEMLVKRITIMPPVTKGVWGLVPLKVPFSPEDVMIAETTDEKKETTVQMVPSLNPPVLGSSASKLRYTLQAGSLTMNDAAVASAGEEVYEPTGQSDAPPAEVMGPPVRKVA